LKPPPVLSCSRVLCYVHIEKSTAYRGRTLLFVDGKELGRVPCMAICEENRTDGVLLFHCSRNWKVLGMSAHKSITTAKEKADWIYPELRKHWRPSYVTKTQARRYLEKSWGDLFCSFCGRRPHEFERLFGKRSPHICGDCVEEFYKRLPQSADAPA
jgi:hypothetical protein